MARVVDWWCDECGGGWEAPGVGRLLVVVERVCPRCGVGVARAWGWAWREDGAMEVVDLEVLS